MTVFKYEPKHRNRLTLARKKQLARLYRDGETAQRLCTLFEIKHVTHVYKILKQLDGVDIDE